MIVACSQKYLEEIASIINDAASAYKGIIPADRWREPYMPEEELKEQIEQGVQFWCYREDSEMMGVMGIQYKEDLTLIRHAYVRSKYRNRGIGSKLLIHLASIATTPVLIGTWADAHWAIRFYQKHGFRLLPEREKEILLRHYWSIPERQVATSVVLASADWNKHL
jgi:GNAT superfamily N-acetyltransferase